MFRGTLRRLVIQLAVAALALATVASGVAMAAGRGTVESTTGATDPVVVSVPTGDAVVATTPADDPDDDLDEVDEVDEVEDPAAEAAEELAEAAEEAAEGPDDDTTPPPWVEDPATATAPYGPPPWHGGPPPWAGTGSGPPWAGSDGDDVDDGA
jgi:hypothetical protein